jgi:hypothetical protein
MAPSTESQNLEVQGWCSEMTQRQFLFLHVLFYGPARVLWMRKSKLVAKVLVWPAVKMIRSNKLDRSPYSAIIQEITHLLIFTKVFEIHLISRKQNCVSHTLANLD